MLSISNPPFTIRNLYAASPNTFRGRVALMDVQNCPHCGVRVIPSNDGTCPSCRKSVTAIAPLVKTPAAAENPFASPAGVSHESSAGKGSNPKEPFSHQAAKFSAYAPFILLLMGFCVQGQIAAHQGTDTGVQLAMVLAGISILTTLAAFVLGWVGVVGGFARRAGWTIAYALVGILLNAGLLTLWVTALLAAFNRRA